MTVAKQLSSHYTVYLVDLRNHGQSFHHHQFDYRAMSQDIQSLVEHLNLSEISILGHSLGGKTAMFFTAQNQQTVKKLIIVDIAPGYYPNRHQLIIDALTAIDIGSLKSRGQADEILKSYVKEPGTRLFLLKNLRRKSANSFEWKINLSVITEGIDNVSEALPNTEIIEVSTLFIRGGASDYITDNDKEVILKQFPNSSILTVEDAGHWVHAEAPQELLELVRRFLD